MINETITINGTTLREARRDFERRFILETLQRHQWQISQTARALGLQRPNLYRKARQLRIQLKPPSEIA